MLSMPAGVGNLSGPQADLQKRRPMNDKKKTASSDEDKQIDIHVGSRVRARRKFLGMSQITLATKLHLTFQQVQKYERGMNRISASKLYQTAVILNVPVSYLFEGLASTTAEIEGASEAGQSFLHTDEGIALANTFPRIHSSKQRAALLAIASVLATDRRPGGN